MDLKAKLFGSDKEQKAGSLCVRHDPAEEPEFHEALFAAAAALRDLWAFRHVRSVHTREGALMHRAAELEMMLSGYLAEHKREPEGK